MKKLQKKLFLSSIFLFTISFQSLALAKVEIVLGLPLEQNLNLQASIPETSAPEIILSREQYVLSYNKNRRSPNWVAWKLESNQMGRSGRSNNFMVDSELETYLKQTNDSKAPVNETEYKGSCYDRGHQVPSADRTDTLANNETTFLMSNMIPQTAYLNRVVWEHLEQYSRDLVQKQGKKLYIIAGPIYDRDLGSIGPQNDIPVPSKDFKIIYILNAGQNIADINGDTPTISVIMPNILQDGSSPDKNPQDLCKPLNVKSADKKDWEKYKASINEIENISGLKFTTNQAKI
jgi:endonuclease G